MASRSEPLPDVQGPCFQWERGVWDDVDGRQRCERCGHFMQEHPQPRWSDEEYIPFE